MAQFAGAETTAPPKHLFTWVDIDEHLALLAEIGQWPGWLRSAEAWWDGLDLAVTEGTTIPTVRSWLDQAFGTGSTELRDGSLALRLDDPTTPAFVGLRVEVRYEEQEAYSAERRLPLLRDKRITASLAKPLARPVNERFDNDVQFIAFHSFKGGVGRTIHAVAFADAIARQGRRVLLIDADLEAPGITWMYRAQGGRMDFSYEDLIALLHGTDGESCEAAVKVASAYLPNQQVGRYPEPGSVTVVPSTRRVMLGPPRIEPADLLTADRSPYFLTEAIAMLGARMGAHVIVADLRAGASELSAPILLDPRVQRIFVTSLSHQSLTGTKCLIKQLGHRAPTIQGIDPAASVIVTQFRSDIHSTHVEMECREISNTLFETLRLPNLPLGDSDVSETIDAEVLSRPLLSPFREELLALPSTWDSVLRVVESARVSESMDSILPIISHGPALQSKNAEKIVDYAILRRRLENTARPLIYAEKEGMSSASGFLVTEPLVRLLGDHRTEPPLALVVGAKGAGKTFLYAKTCVAQSWDKFAEESGIRDVRLKAPIVPVLESENLESKDVTTQGLRDDFAARNNLIPSIPNSALEIKGRLQQGLANLGENEQGWRELWLECLAIAAGIHRDSASPEIALTELAKTANAVFVIDGLEDLLQSIDKESKRTALRVLLTDVLAWLRSLRGRSLGLVVFVRQDLVTRAVKQNSGQLLARYEPYALRWDKEEALRLALWVTARADALPESRLESEISSLTYDDLVEALIPVWGWKMGTEKSKEARSHLWVPAALGDFRDQVQARDVVVFLAEAAKESISQPAWEDRVLAPSAMRKALLACSTNKIDSIKQENQEVGDLLGRLQQVRQPVTVPFELEEVGLDVKEADFLVDSGVFARGSDGRYWVAEIYRHGLGFGSERRAKVLWRR
ncbi:AAA family ATPase [Nocardia sp. NPDC004654]|uniref:KGGVGR-motif variant AAA ATPase n=1 Tax=Nocardia sp. NPDC004654 TaxID=3154776 RepID=UPI0033B98573